MDPFKILKLGNKYSKKDLSDLLEQPTLSLVREGLYHCKNSAPLFSLLILKKREKKIDFTLTTSLKGTFFIGIHKLHNIKFKRL